MEYNHKERTMSFDGFFLHHMVEELRRELVNGRIQKINQPFEMCIRDRSYGEQEGLDNGESDW